MLRAAASLELFHTFALIHDDIMDASDTRRGRPTIHRSLAAQYRNHGDLAATDRYGTSVAILLGDLALVWSDEMFHTCGLTPHQLSVARPLLDAMRTEVMIGQYLDLLSAGDETGDVDSALSIVLFKTAKYTVERPLQMGATVAGADQDVLDACSAFALPIGEAFQLRDDLLGVFGDPAITGKSRLDDLREGKATALLAFALRRANKTQRALLRRLIGNPDLDESGAAVVRGIFIETGALPAVNAMIRERRQQALTALDHAQFRPAATAALYEIAHRATVRTS
jgi:geranylgeranyl diphosphate synthase type I